MGSVKITKPLVAEASAYISDLLHRRCQIVLKEVDPRMKTGESALAVLTTPEERKLEKVVRGGPLRKTMHTGTSIKCKLKLELDRDFYQALEQGQRQNVDLTYVAETKKETLWGALAPGSFRGHAIPPDSKLYRALLWQYAQERNFRMANRFRIEYVKEYLNVRSTLGIVQRDWPELLSLLNDSNRIAKLGRTKARGEKYVTEEDRVIQEDIIQCCAEGLLLSKFSFTKYFLF